MSQNLGDIYFSKIPYSRLGEYTGKIKCPCHYEFWRHVEDVFHIVKDKIIVDMGCGPGLKTLTLALAGATLIGIDHSRQRMDEFKKNLTLVENLYGKLRVSFYEHDLREKNPFLKSDFADFILCYEVIEHLNRLKIFIQEMVRIIKPGGRILITTPNKKFCPVEKGERVYGERLHRHKQAFEAISLKSIFNIDGISVEKVFFYKHTLMQIYCGIIHRFMQFDKYRHALPVLACNLYNRIAFPILNLFVRCEESLKRKRDTGKHIFIIFKKSYQ